MIQAGSNVMKKDVLITVREQNFEIGDFGRVLAECEEIRKEAKTRLAKLVSDSGKNEEVEKTVCDFLKTSIERILGFGAVSKIFGHEDCPISELTEVLCHVISQVGGNLAKMSEEAKDET